LRAKLDGKSPTSVAVAFGQMIRGGSLTFREAMKMEYRIVNEIMQGHDFYEGVRALLIDKDKSPKWQPARFADLSEKAIAAHFDEASPHVLAFERGAP
jgi:enoyl-CoA hydratase